jgi:hypothetical protein
MDILNVHWFCPIIVLPFFFFFCNSPHWTKDFSFTRFLDHTQRRTTVGRTPLDEWSARRRDNTQHSQRTDIHASGGIRTHNLSRRAAEELRLRPRGQLGPASSYLEHYYRRDLNLCPMNPSGSIYSRTWSSFSHRISTLLQHSTRLI